MTALDYDDISAGTLVGIPHVGPPGHFTLDNRDEMLWHHYAKQQQQQQQQHHHQQQQHHHPHHLQQQQQQPPQHTYDGSSVGTLLLRGGGLSATPTSTTAQLTGMSPSAENLPTTLQQQMAIQQHQQQQQQQHQQQQHQGLGMGSFGVAPKFHQSDPELLYGNEAPLLLQDCNADSMVSHSRFSTTKLQTIFLHSFLSFLMYFVLSFVFILLFAITSAVHSE